MKRFIHFLGRLFITIQLIIHYGQTEIIENIKLDDLSIDEAYLTLINKNHPDSIYSTYNLVVCEHCPFERLFQENFPKNTSRTGKISTRFPYDLEIFAETPNRTLVCRIESYSFNEHGTYTLEVSLTDEGETSCNIHLNKDSGYYWTPVICAVLYICCLVLMIQLYNYISNSRYVGRILTNIGHQRLINNDTESVTTTTTTHEPLANEMLGARTSISELPLVGSTRISNNSIKISKILPKRLRALDTFRGFALMIMIFVNYGGKISFRIISFFIILSLRWWLLVF